MTKAVCPLCTISDGSLTVSLTLALLGGSPPQPVVPTPKDKSGAPPVRSIYDDLSSPAIGMSPMGAHKQVRFNRVGSIPLLMCNNTLHSEKQCSNSLADHWFGQ